MMRVVLMRAEFIFGLQDLIQHDNSFLRISTWVLVPILLPLAILECVFSREDEDIDERWGVFFLLLDEYLIWGIIVTVILVQLMVMFFICSYLIKGQLSPSHLIGYAPFIYISIMTVYNLFAND